MKYIISLCLGIIIWSYAHSTIEAHIPFISNDTHVNKESALEISEISVSKVIYQRLTYANPKSWIKFNSDTDEVLHIQIGIPKIADLQDYRPNVTIFETSTSPPTPILSAEYVNLPKEFHEPFTNTYSWILYDEKIPLKKNTIYYISSFGDEIDIGKLWIGIGYKEQFSISDWVTLPASIDDIREFHSPENSSIESSKTSNKYNQNYTLAVICVLFVLIVIVIVYIYSRRKSKYNN